MPGYFSAHGCPPSKNFMTSRSTIGVARNRLTQFQPSVVAHAAVLAAQNGIPLGSASLIPLFQQSRLIIVILIDGIQLLPWYHAHLNPQWSMAAENDAEVDDELTKG